MNDADPSKPDPAAALAALERVSIEMTVEPGAILEKILQADVPEIHQDVKGKFKENIRAFARDKSGVNPPIFPVVGPAGSGKTHLLASFKEIVAQSNGYFVPLEMPTLDSFHVQLNAAIVDALLANPPGGGPTQLERLFRNILAACQVSSTPKNLPKWFKDLNFAKLSAIAEKLFAKLASLFPAQKSQLERSQDVFRCLVFLNSPDEAVFSTAYSFLRDVEGEDYASGPLRLQNGLPKVADVFFALTFILRLNNSFAVIAIDQLDAILYGFNSAYRPPDASAPPEMDRPQSLFEANVRTLYGYLSDLRKYSHRAQIVVTALGDAWNGLAERDARKKGELFGPALLLPPLDDLRFIELLVARNLQGHYAAAGFTPPYPSWPFPPAFYASQRASHPREILRACYRHVYQCVAAGRAEEWQTTVGSPPPEDSLTARFRELRALPLPAGLKDPSAEKTFWQPVLEVFLECFLWERRPLPEPYLLAFRHSLSPNSKVSWVLAALDIAKASFPVRSLYVAANLHSQANSFIARLKSVLLASGVKLANPKSALRLIRFKDPPSGPASQALWRTFLKEGGKTVTPTDDVIASLHALWKLREETRHPHAFRAWVERNYPTRSIPFLADEFIWLLEKAAPET
ncbi:MAG: hypothetical protein LBO66_04015 [Deltaproteobacteria bacterium]|jgi:hypothetical protein|nr:hypothetical protein [Deltaproteobacteria bacterium]